VHKATWQSLLAQQRHLGTEPGDQNPPNTNSKNKKSATAVSWLENPFRAAIDWFRNNQERMKALLRQYGPFAVATWLALYLTALFGFWGLVRAGVVQGPDVNEWLSRLPTWVRASLPHDKSGDKVALPPSVSEFLAAWLLTKTTEPPRLAIALVLIPSLVRIMPPWARSLVGVSRAAESPEGAAGAPSGSSSGNSANSRGD